MKSQQPQSNTPQSSRFYRDGSTSGPYTPVKTNPNKDYVGYGLFELDTTLQLLYITTIHTTLS